MRRRAKRAFADSSARLPKANFIHREKKRFDFSGAIN